MKNPSGLEYKTKAETLQDLRDKVKLARVPDLKFFSLAEWSADSIRILHDLMAYIQGRIVVVRSSAISEDATTRARILAI